VCSSDLGVDRPDVEAPQGVELTGTNRPTTYPTTTHSPRPGRVAVKRSSLSAGVVKGRGVRVHCMVPGQQTPDRTPFSATPPVFRVWSCCGPNPPGKTRGRSPQHARTNAGAGGWVS